MACVELAQQRRDPGDADRVRRGESQPAARAALQLADGAFGFVEFARDALAMFEVDVAGFGEAELARSAVKQLRAETGFEFLHLSADGGLWQLKSAGGGNETAVLDHFHEDQGVVEIAGHVGVPWARTGRADGPGKPPDRIWTDDGTIIPFKSD